MGTSCWCAEKVNEMSDRYHNNPLLRLLDCYILDAIGQLPAEQAKTLDKLEPRFQETFGESGTWREIVEAQMGFSKVAAQEMRAFWEGYLQQAKHQGVPVGPNEFVIDFVKQNFRSLLDDQ